MLVSDDGGTPKCICGNRLATEVTVYGVTYVCRLCGVEFEIG